jgi:hypothetical protein
MAANISGSFNDTEIIGRRVHLPVASAAGSEAADLVVYEVSGRHLIVWTVDPLLNSTVARNRKVVRIPVRVTRAAV